MKKSNIFGTSDKRSVNPDWFTGKVWMKALSGRIGSKGQDIYHVHFRNGARTKIHSHNGPQLLIAVNGRGSLDTYRRYGTKESEFGIKKTGTVRLNRGDVVHIPPGSLHTHGSVSRDAEFSHIAINTLPPGKPGYETDWFESDFETRVSRKI